MVLVAALPGIPRRLRKAAKAMAVRCMETKVEEHRRTAADLETRAQTKHRVQLKDSTTKACRRGRLTTV
nr:hypothetical protein CE91St29_09200 [Corynebacterium striatum]